MFNKPGPTPSVQPITDAEHVPAIFADEALGAFVRHSTVHITFAAPRIDYTAGTGHAHRAVVAQIVMPACAIEALHRLLARLMQQLQDPNAPLTPRVIQ